MRLRRVGEMRLGNTQTDTAPRRRPTRNGVGMRYPFDRRKRSRRRFRAAVAHRRRDGKILYRAVPRRGGRVVDGSGLENRQGASPRGFESHPLRPPGYLA